MTFSLSVISFIIEFLIAMNCLGDIMEEKLKKRYTFLIGISLYAVALVVFVLIENVYINSFVFFVINFLFAYFCFECTVKNGILCSLFLSVMMVVTEFLFILGSSITENGNIITYSTSLASYTIGVVLSKLMYFVLTKLIIYFGFNFRKVITPLPRNIRSLRTPAFLFLFPLCSIVILIAFWTISSVYELTQDIQIIISAAGIAIVVSIILTYVFYGKTTRELDELYKAQSDAERVHTDIAYYAILDKQNDMLKTFIHDEKNHLSVIKSLADNPEVSDYIDKIYGEISHHSMFGNTKNKMLDLMINKYQYICRSGNIEFYVQCKTSNLNYIENSDLITLFGNMLDNAVEAAKSSTNKKIDLTMNRVNGFDIITCTNSCDKKPQSIGKMLKTTKTDDGFHGLGVNSIKRIVKKYSGDFEWSYDENSKEFVVYIAFKD